MRMESPLRVIRLALCTNQSRIVSAWVGSPTLNLTHPGEYYWLIGVSLKPIHAALLRRHPKIGRLPHTITTIPRRQVPRSTPTISNAPCSSFACNVDSTSTPTRTLTGLGI